MSGMQGKISSDNYDGYYHYLPVNDTAMLWGTYLTGLGSGKVPAGREYPPAGHPGLYSFTWARGRVLPEFQIILISEGSGVFESEETGEIRVNPGTVLILFPGVWHRYRPDINAGWTERWISFNGAMMHRLMDLTLVQPQMAVRSVKAPASLAKTFDKFLDRTRKATTQNSILLSLQAMSLIATVVESIVEQHELPGDNRTVRDKNVQDPMVARALELIWTHSHHAFSVQKFADVLGVSRRALERHFREELGHTVLNEIAACRLSRAKRLLRETDLGVKMVAYLSGFPSEDRMRVFFLKKEKMPPSQYRSEKMAERKPQLGRPSNS